MPHYGKAIRHLYPDAVRLVDYDVSDEGDGLGPRITFWNEATLGPQPTRAQFEAAVIAFDAAQTQAATDAATLRQAVLTLAGSAVGQSIGALTAAQVRALVAILLWQAGALKPDGTVRPLAEWAR